MKPPEAWAYGISLAARDWAQAVRLREPPSYPEGTCFFAQQAAEKALKAYACY